MIVVLDLYVRKGHAQQDPEVFELARLTGRTESSIVLRLGNYMHVDPKNSNQGMLGGRAQCEPLFQEFEGKPLRLADEAADARRRLAENPRPSSESQTPERTHSAPKAKTGGDGIAEYAGTRLHFKANVIEPLGWDVPFRMKTPFGTYQMTKGEFYEAFPKVVKTDSYLVGRHYHGANLHLKAERFRVD